MGIARFANEVLAAPFYRARPWEAARYAYAKWLFSKYRMNDPAEFLTRLGVRVEEALDGFENWREELEDALRRVREQGGVQGGVSLEDGVILYGLARAVRPAVVIETGVAAGISSSFIGAALIENGGGHLYSIELPEQEWTLPQSDGNRFSWAAKGVGWAIPARVLGELGPRRHLVLEDVRAALPRLLEELGTVDMFFHDDLHLPDHMRWEYELVWPRLREGGVLVSDDADFGWVSFCRDRDLGRESLCNVQRLTAIRKATAPATQ